MATAQHQAHHVADEIFHTMGEVMSSHDVEDLQANPPEEPDFPWLMFGAALFKDMLDSMDITGVGAVITTVFSFFFAAIIFIWLIGKVSFIQRRIVRKQIARRLVIAIGVEFIPVVKLIPTWALFVLFAHYREKKVVQLIWSILSRAEGPKLKRVA